MSTADPAAVVVTEAMLALGRRGHDPVITDVNGPRLMHLAGLMLAEFGVRERVGDERSPADARDHPSLVAEQRDALADCPAG